ncbi:DNA-binding domain-containing protein [Pseudomonas sp. 148P]|uniref:DNA-binding domain-containing protein n=1 Tax=Pseudomonas ulcerans TaxID=3115852 RepID=A0ABU7I0S5_9PSED|nr:MULTISPECIES: DNA-binding domain-containing protein [unclassified Pseudomonas]MEE1926120.1 DNA-binding domain-containing protein [Pseudomonas sp. 147P]MEE1937427.1 DNA-binding domain-containing protein [Pseudomonas sp. 148P]
MKLAQFQDAFVEALYQRPAPALADLSAQPAFTVYRNTVLKGCVDALCANFPALERLVGSPWLRAAASDYALRSPPTDARLVQYGAAFPAFLDELENLGEWPWLADVARLDHDWLTAFCAPDETALTLAALAGNTASDLANRCLQPRRGARWRWCEPHPVYSLWQHGRDELEWNDDIPWQGEGSLLVGSPAGVSHQPLEKGGCAFLEACASGHSLDHASTLALQVQADLDFTDLLGRLLRAGVFLSLE